MGTPGIQHLTQLHGPEEIPGERRSRTCIGMHPLDQCRGQGLCALTELLQYPIEPIRQNLAQPLPVAHLPGPGFHRLERVERNLCVEKLAGDDWVWDSTGARIRENDLVNLATNGRTIVEDSFGSTFADEFAKSPTVFFEALPEPNKLVGARMAMDRNSTGSNE